jgi:hypothetical protein
MSNNTTINTASNPGDVVRTLDRTAAKTQVMHLDFGGDTGAGNEQLVTQTNPLPTAGTGSYFIVSTLNSSSAQLQPGQSFIGTIEAIPTALNLSLNIPTDQDLMVIINFYEASGAGTYIGSLPAIMVTGGTGLNRSFPTNGNYCNVVVTNISLLPTTTLIINSQYGTIASLDQAGNNLVGVYGTNELKGFNLIEECIKGNMPLNASITNPELRDANGAMILSDAPVSQRLLASTAGQTFTIDTQGYQTLSISMGTMAATLAGTNDLAAGATPGAISAYPVVLGAATSSLAAANSYLIPCLTRYVRLTVTTAGWATYYQRTQPLPSSYLANAPVNISQIGTSPVLTSLSNGSSYRGLGVSQMTAVSQVDQSATAFAGSGRVVGTVVASAQGGGGVISAEINVTALTLGTATSVIAILQESTGGTNFTDIWTSDLITTVSIVRCPAIPVAGRRRWAFFSVGGTSTTVTVTITSLELPLGSYPLLRQFRDAFSTTNPFATQINSAAQTASTLALTTLSTATTVFNIEGCTGLAAFATFVGGVPTTQPVLTLQLSMDGSTFWNSSATITPTAAGVFMTSLANFPAKYARLIVSTASAGGTAYTLGAVGINAVN